MVDENKENDIEHLKWLRDGCNWLVTIAAGIIVASATFYTDIIGQCPKLKWLILVGWGVLLISIISGVICYFSVFKKVIKKNYELKTISWVGLSYSIMIFSFLGGIQCLGFFIIYNKW